MRIICLEEHVVDQVVASAVKDASAAEVPYVADVGSRYQDDPAREPADRPRLMSLRESMKAATEPLSVRVAAMDEAAIDCQVISLTNEPQLAAQGDAVDLVRGANDRLAEAVAKYPNRFSAFFTLPWQNPEEAVREAERCVRKLNLPATMLMGRPNGEHFVDDACFEPVLAKLAELDAPLYIHPGPPLHAVQQPYYGGFNPDLTARLSLFGWGWHHEAGIQVVRLILSGALDRHRGLRIISGHWGEMVPFFLQRMDDTMPPAVTGLARTIGDTYREQVWVGPSGMLNTPHLMFIREVLGIERIVFSVDYPYLTMSGARDWLENLPIPDSEKEAIAFRNAQTLLRLS
jgi:predicted TIM-barrel fold metal-dependent hydrolase